MIGSSANDTRTEPAKARAVRHCVGLALNLPGAVRGKKLAKILSSFSADPDTSMRKLIRPDVLLEVFLGIQRWPGLEHHNAEAAFGEDFCGGAA